MEDIIINRLLSDPTLSKTYLIFTTTKNTKLKRLIVKDFENTVLKLSNTAQQPILEKQDENSYRYELPYIDTQLNYLHIEYGFENGLRGTSVIPHERMSSFTVIETLYDAQRRLLEIVARTKPRKQYFDINVWFKGKEHGPWKKNIFVSPTEELYGGTKSEFRYRLFDVGPGEIRDNVAFFIYYVDNTKEELRVTIPQPKSPLPLIGPLNCTIKPFQKRIDAEYWMRRDSPIDHLDLRFGKRRMLDLPRILDTHIRDEDNQRDILCEKLIFGGEIENTISEGRALLEESWSISSIDLKSKFHLGSKGHDPAKIECFHQVAVDNIKIGLLGVDVASNQLCIHGCYFGRSLKKIKVFQGSNLLASENYTLREPNELGSTYWHISTVAKSIILAKKDIRIELYQENDELIGSESIPQDEFYWLGRDDTAGALSQKLIDRFFEFLTVKDHADESWIFVTMTSDLVSMFGGAWYRVLTLVNYYSRIGYKICLVDRCSVSSINKYPSRYQELRTSVDRHIFIPNRLKKSISLSAVQEINKRTNTLTIDSKIYENLENSANLGRLKRGKSTSIYSKMDSQFNNLTAYLTNLHQPSILLSAFVWSAESMELVSDQVLKVIDAHDVQSERFKSLCNAYEENVSKYNLEKPELYEAYEEDEISELHKADLVIAISKNDQRILCDYIGAEKVIYAGVCAEPHQLTIAETFASEQKNVVFIGNGYLPNILGIHKFIQFVWPSVLEKNPDARLRIIGNVCEHINLKSLELTSFITDTTDETSAFRELNIDLLGVCEDIDTEMSRAMISVNPIEYGSGQCIKVIEAIGYNTLTVTTPYGAQDLEDIGQSDAISVCKIDDMASEINALMANSELREKKLQRMKLYLDDYLSSKRCFANLTNFFESKLFYS